MSGGAFYAPVKAQPAPAPATLAADVAAVKQLVNELSHARPGSSTQTAQHLSGRLKLLREKMDGGSSRNELNKLIRALDESIASHAASRHTLT